MTTTTNYTKRTVTENGYEYPAFDPLHNDMLDEIEAEDLRLDKMLERYEHIEDADIPFPTDDSTWLPYIERNSLFPA